MRKYLIVFMLSLAVVAVVGCGSKKPVESTEASTESYVDPFVNPSAAEGQRIDISATLEEIPENEGDFVLARTEDGRQLAVVIYNDATQWKAGDKVNISGEVSGTMENKEGAKIPIVDDTTISRAE